MAQTNKFIIEKYINKSRDNIIQKYSEGMPIYDIAELYGVANSTIYIKLAKWGIKIKKYKGARGRKIDKPRKRYKRKFSPELQAIMKENSRINNSKIGCVEFTGGTEDQKLVRNLSARCINYIPLILFFLYPWICRELIIHLKRLWK